MSYNNNIAISGNLTRDPELLFSADGNPYARLSIAYNHYKKDGEDEVSFFNVVCFSQIAENVAESLWKGDRVNVTGHLQQNRWETEDGESRSSVQIVADEVSPSLRWAVAVPEKNSRPEETEKPKTKSRNAYREQRGSQREQTQRRSQKTLKRYSRDEPF